VYALSQAYVPCELQGTYAEFALVKEEWLARAPASLSLADAAAVPLVALTALQALERAAPQPGQRLLVTGASGGVGHVAVQLAKCLFDGLHVTAVASARHAEWMTQLGADAVFDYAAGPDALAAAFGGSDATKFHIVLDVVGGPLLDAAVRHCVAPGGFVSEVLNRGTDSEAAARYAAAAADGSGPKYEATLVQPSGAQLMRLAELIDAGKLRVKVAQTLPLEQAGRAHDIVIDGHAGGKVVLTM
jgi:NADPH:quinone reductase-like Zn-dependent oxidoreductase